MKNWQIDHCTFEIFISLSEYLFETINYKQMNSIQLILLHHFNKSKIENVFHSNEFFGFIEQFISIPYQCEVIEEMILRFASSYPIIVHNYLLFIQQTQSFPITSIIKKCLKIEHILMYLIENNNCVLMKYINSIIEKSSYQYLLSLQEKQSEDIQYKTIGKSGNKIQKQQKIKKENIGLNDLIETISKSIRIKNELIFKFQEKNIFMIDLAIRSGIQCIELVMNYYQNISIQQLEEIV